MNLWELTLAHVTGNDDGAASPGCDAIKPHT